MPTKGESRKQKAYTAEGKTKVVLTMEDLRLHGCGVFSNVYRGVLLDPEPRREIAIKKTWPSLSKSKRYRRSAECKILRLLNPEGHKNITQLLYIFRNTGPDRKVCESLVFQFYEFNLSSIIEDLGGEDANFLDIKLYTWQLFNGLAFLTKHNICHRDIKPDNLLVEPINGELKITDFGSAKIIRKKMRTNTYQVTRFYRPPELLLDASSYSAAIDVWSGGCVLGEMIGGQTLFPGRNSVHQLVLIVSALGLPSEKEMKDMKATVTINSEIKETTGLTKLLPFAPDDFLQILINILRYSPNKRLCGRQLLKDHFFEELFIPDKKRKNGSLVSRIITYDDIIDLEKYVSSEKKEPLSILTNRAPKNAKE